MRRRAQYIGERHADLVAEVRDTPNWQNAPTKPRLVRRVESELEHAEAYIRKKLGNQDRPGPLGGGADAVTPPHLDLDDVSRIHVNTPPRTAQGIKAGYLRLRIQRVPVIAWRAAALHDEMWEAASDRASATLREAVIDELLDRRLRSVERMTCNVSYFGVMDRGRRWRRPLTGASGPWRDRFRVRPIEYPRLLRISEPLAELTSTIGPENIGPAGFPPFTPLPGTDRIPPWVMSGDEDRFDYNVPPPPGTRFPPRLVHDFANRPEDTYTYLMLKRRPASEIVDDLFMVGLPDTDRENFWERTWLLCDHCLSAIHIESLRFGLARRTGSDLEFNRLHAEKPEGYIALSAFPGEGDLDHLMADAENDLYFENFFDDPDVGTPVGKVADLQIGDHIVFWNSFLYRAMTRGDWRLEHSLVMDVDSDPDSGGIHLANLRLQGHGIRERHYREYQREILKHVEKPLAKAQKRAKDVGTDPTRSYVEVEEMRLVRWSPYEAFAAPGAWWLELPPETDDYNQLRRLPQMVRNLPPDQRGSGYNEPPIPGALYFPLFVPRGENTWKGYLQRRKADPAVVPPALDATKLDVAVVPGLTYGGRTRSTRGRRAQETVAGSPDIESAAAARGAPHVLEDGNDAAGRGEMLLPWDFAAAAR